MLPWMSEEASSGDKVRSQAPALTGGASEDAWIEVIQKMDEVYSDLVASQTQLEQQNVRLEEAQLFIGSVLASMTDVLIVCDVAGHIQQVNPALEAMTGAKERALIGKPLSVLLSDDGGAEMFAGKGAGFRAFSDCHAFSDYEVSLAGADGVPAPLSMNCTVRRDHKGKVAGYVLVGRPVGELRRAYEQLDSAHQQLTQTQQQLVVSEKMAALGRLVAGVAHELNNPISFIFGNMHALKRYSAAFSGYFARKPAETQEERDLRAQLKIDRIVADMTPLIEGSLEGAERVSDIVKDLLRFSSNQEEAQEMFDLVRLARTAADWVVKGERVKPELRIDAPAALDMVSRKGLLHQIIVNLVQNAVDVLADCDSRVIEIAIGRDGDAVNIAVADNGSGIPADLMDKIFEPFFTTKPIGQGTGLGLYVSYSMAQKLGGDLIAANRPAGGAVFTLKVPFNDLPRK